ncbi:MAG: hypothetical protein Q7U57_00465 [Methylovulum sp.]|nr:hypothetical protein [Methylovulum sp.]
MSQTYADLSNEQMLMNLARRANSHSSYFMQMSSINSSFSFGATMGGTFTDSRTIGAVVANVLTKAFSFVGTLGLSATESPNFSFTPLSGEVFATSLFSPIDTKVFFEQLRQGVPVDQLMRILLVSVNLEYPSGKKMVLNNMPDNKLRPHNFRNFLRLAALTRQLQLNQALNINVVKGENVLEIPPEAGDLLTKLYSDPSYSFWQDGMVKLNTSDGIPKVSFIMRPFSAILGAVGHSQQHFDEWLQTGGKLTEVPDFERKPILKMRWGEHDKLTPAVAEVEYLGMTYKIADVDDEEHSTWNRDSFKILTDLFTIISIDPKQLPMQQLIKVF